MAVGAADTVLSVGGDYHAIRPTTQQRQGGSSQAAAVRRAATFAGLMMLAAIAALAMGGGSAHRTPALAISGAWGTMTMGQAKSGPVPNQELQATEAASAAAADAAGVISSEAAPEVAAAPPAVEGEAAPAAGEAPVAEEAAAAAPQESAPANGASGVQAVVAGGQNGPSVEGGMWQAPQGFPFSASEGSTSMVEKPLDMPYGSTEEFPSGVVYSGPPVVGGTTVGPGGRLIVNMAGQPRSGTAMIERPQINGLPQNVMQAISSAEAQEPQPAATMNEAPTDASAVAGGEEERGGEGGDGADAHLAAPSDEEVSDIIAKAFEGDMSDARDLVKGAFVKSGGVETQQQQPGDNSFVVQSGPAVTAGGDWTYGPGETGPAHWGALGYPTCSTGLRQSPINIEENVMRAALPTLAWQIPAGGAAGGGVTWSGRSIVATGYEAQFGYDGRSYQLMETVVHTPSEHTFGGQAYPMEIQFVHSTMVQGVPKYLIVSAFVRTHTQSNQVLSRLASAAEGLSRGAVSLAGLGFEEVAMSMLGQMEAVNPTVTNAQNYYQYEGSLTAPPCQQETQWVLLKNALSITFGDLEKITNVQGSNSRPVQAIGDRRVFDSHVAV